jgi:hypothetical protein
MEPRPWADLVFHVLAHVAAGAHLAPSLHDARYVQQAAAHLGPAHQRPLAEDARALGALLRDHDSMARAQHLAWLFRSTEEALAAGASPLASLRPEQVARPALLDGLRHDAAELLFCAALLEHDPWSALPSLDLSCGTSVHGGSMDRAIRALIPAAPGLAGARVAGLRALGLRGRVAFGEIWVGVPGWGEATEERCAWQAAHEATVQEVERRWPAEASSHEVREAWAVELLRRRAEALGLAEAHGRWLSSFAVPVVTAELPRGAW